MALAEREGAALSSRPQARPLLPVTQPAPGPRCAMRATGCGSWVQGTRTAESSKAQEPRPVLSVGREDMETSTPGC